MSYFPLDYKKLSKELTHKPSKFTIANKPLLVAYARITCLNLDAWICDGPHNPRPIELTSTLNNSNFSEQKDQE